MTTLVSILNQMKTLTIDEQRILNKELVAMINRTSKVDSMKAAQQFKIGDEVIFDAKSKGLIKIKVTSYSRDGANLKGPQIGGLRPGCNWTVAANICDAA